MLFFTTLASAAYDAGLATGKIIGVVFWGCLLLAGILKCLKIMKRPRTSSLCVSSLLVFLLTWLLGNTVHAISDSAGWSTMATVGTAAVLMLLCLVSVVLAVSGLVVMGTQKGRYDQGKAQAIWALVLSCGLILVGVGAWVGALRKQQGDDGGMARFSVQEMKDYREWNFRFGTPMAPWRKMEAKQLNPDAFFVYAAQQPERYLGCIVEKNAALTRADLVEFSVDRMKGMARTMTEISRSEERRGGLTFTRLKVKLEGVQGGNLTLFYDNWLSCTEKYAYQFNFWTRQAPEVHAAEVEKWMDSFSLIQPDAEAKSPGELKDGAVPTEGYASTLGAAGWKADSESEFPEAQLLARKGKDRLALVLVPLPEGAAVRAADVDKRMLETMKVGESDKLKGPEPVTHQGIEGRRYTFARKLDGSLIQFEVRMLQISDRILMLVTWGSGPPEEREKAAQLVKLFPPEAGEPEKLKDIVVKTRALILNDLGIECYRRQEYPRALRLFELAQSWQPEDPAMAGNVIDALQQMGKQETALASLTKMTAQGRLAELPVMQARLAQLLAQNRDLQKAAAIWEQLFKNDYANEDHLMDRINVLLELEEKQKALTAVAAYSKLHPSPRITRWHASVLGRNDRWDEALAMLAPALEGKEPDPESLYLSGELENDAGKYEASEKTARRLLAAGEETARTYLIMGWSEWHRKRWKGAREAFEAAAEKAPESSVVKEALAMSAGVLGQGTPEVSRTPLEPVALPEAVKEAIAALPQPPDALIQGHGAILQERHVGCYYEPGKAVRVTQYYKVKVLDNNGVEAFSTLSVKFYPASELVHVNSLKVWDESGKVVQQGGSEDAYTRTENGELVTGAQVLNLPVPGLRRGCPIEAVITVQDKAKSTTAPFRRDLLASGYPALARAWFFTGDISAWKFAVSPGMKEITGKNFRAYLTVMRRAYRNEGFLPELEDWQPWGMAGPAGVDWKTLAGDYLKRISDRLEPDASTEAVWENLKKDVRSPEDKLGVIVRHVQSSLTYKGLEFGTRALVPSPVKKIQQDQYGDCKDHTMLLYHLLRRAGIVCHPALVDTSWKLRADLPSLDQFNHMILYVPGSRQPWLDATVEWLDLTSTLPDYLADRQALVLDPKNPRLETIGKAAPSEVGIVRVMSPEGARDAKVEETLTLTGAAASWAREWLLNYPPAEHAGLIRRQLDSQGNFTLHSVELDQAEDRSRPFTLRMVYSLPEAFRPDVGILKVPMFWEGDYLSVMPVEDRQSPFRLNPAMKFRCLTRFTGAWAGMSALAESAGDGKTTGTTWKLAWQTGPDDQAGLKLEVDVLEGQYPPADWATFQQSRRSLLERMKRVEVKKL